MYSNLARYDGIREGLSFSTADLGSLYTVCRTYTVL